MNKIIFEDMKYIYESDIDWTMFKNKTVLVTGATGMIASYLVMSLLYINDINSSYNIHVIAMARSKEKINEKFREYMAYKNFRFIIGDVNEPLSISDNVDYIIHGASLASSQYYNINPIGTLLPNVVGTYQLLEFARIKNVSGFLFMSSGEIYGEVKGADEISETDYGYIDPIDIRSCYSESKRMGETMCKAWQHQHNISAKIARIYHTYGPTMNIKEDKRVFAEFVSNIVNNEDIVMKSDGSPIRPFCYLSDVTIALFKVLLYGKPGEAYNVCNSQNLISIKELAKILVDLYPEKQLRVIRQERTSQEEYMENKRANIVSANTNKLKTLGWEPKYSVAEGFYRTIQSISSGNE